MCDICIENDDSDIEFGCACCGCVRGGMNPYFDTSICDSCKEMEENTDWDKFEEDKRRRISEQNEY